MRVLVLCLVLFCSSLAFAADPVPGETLVQGSDFGGNVWAVRATDVKASYYLYAGESGRMLATVSPDYKVSVAGLGVMSLKNGEVFLYPEQGGEVMYPVGSTGRTSFFAIMRHYLGM